MNVGDPKFLTGDVITAARLGKRDDALAAALPKNGTEPMSAKLDAPGLVIRDKRNAATLPADYSKEWTIGFKTLIDVGLNGIASGIYCTVIGVKGWSDDSGGKAQEIALTDSGTYVRNGTTVAGWGAWMKLPEVNPTTGEMFIGTAAAPQRVATEKFAIALAVALGG